MMTSAWRDFAKCVVVYKCRVEQRTPVAASEVHRAVRALASITSKEPWDLTADELRLGLSLAPQRSRKFKAICGYFDENFLGKVITLRDGVMATRTQLPNILHTLSERKSAEKLPDREALYELTRIIWREVPRGHFDAMRFYALRLLLLTGLRVYEVTNLPVDCLREEGLTLSTSADLVEEMGGAKTVMYLRYFAEKTSSRLSAMHLHEKRQYIPVRFQGIVRETVGLIQAATDELRRTLRNQFSAGCRHIWQYAPNDEVPLTEACELLGLNWPNDQSISPQTLLGKALHIPASEVSATLTAERLERYFSEQLGKKSDFRQFRLPDDTDMPASELLFLVPAKRSNYRDADLNMYAAINTFSPQQVSVALGLLGSGKSLFGRYGATEAVHAYRLNAHMFRHLLNTELFRQAVADTIITHHFGRESVAQSYEYDHRSLLEKLDFIDLPQVGQDLLGGSPAELIGKMVIGGLAPESHIARSFKKVQREQGDITAFEYLKANADGFHVTPYGFCANSFSLNPCARHLKCFDNCGHFVASEKKEHRFSLEALKASLVATRERANAKPIKSVGRTNQIEHATKLIAGVESALAAMPGAAVFVNGVDHSSQPVGVFE
ncbi:hypothetical protein [Massilia aquatica]|uniref:Integrase n=1 Tax=Massilia aquatica TaxID=2609000 RepID=A0ABX0MHB0_9BURK|nr:hypothetical protein [Massilia aquatica]NHZ43637.1 hypothetical protein [Massilia aquatica]